MLPELAPLHAGAVRYYREHGGCRDSVAGDGISSKSSGGPVGPTRRAARKQKLRTQSSYSRCLLADALVLNRHPTSAARSASGRVMTLEAGRGSIYHLAVENSTEADRD